jgi:methyl-accepting chemotaxis protein
MKNLKIRLKILVSFGIVILLILILAIVVITSNVSTSNNVNNMRAEIQLQVLSAELVEHVSFVNSGFNMMSYSFDNAYYNYVLSEIEECRQRLVLMDRLVNEHDSFSRFRGQVTAVSAAIDNWRRTLDDINARNNELKDVMERANTSKDSLIGMSMALFHYQMTITRDEIHMSGEDDAVRRLIRIDRIRQSVEIATKIGSIGGVYDVMFTALDTSGIEETQALFDETVTILTDFLGESTTLLDVGMATGMLEALNRYGADIDDFLISLSQRQGLIQAGRNLTRDVTGMVDDLMSDIETSALQNADSTISSSNLSLIVVIVVIAVVVLVSMLLALYISGLISKPVSLMSAFMKKAGATGDISTTATEEKAWSQYYGVKDELGQMMKDFNAFIGHIVTTAKELEVIASGDLTVDIELLSDNDMMGKSLNKMVENLSGMFYEINLSSSQVSSGSKQISDSSQNLAQGSTQQAATVQQLSASASEIAEKTKANTQMASKAANLAGTIKTNAEKGSRQMDEMVSAVGEISQASQSISKVIKAIDDIAFQTNILALNAAVEAARAGQHGKGFAVVADEVRNLAAKSAEAAKDTGILISNSMEKAEHGARIAKDTSESLAGIVSGINESSEIIGEIAKSSEAQSTGIEQINISIDQVAQVVQQNSATAQESAAASEELSAQADTLEGLVAQFRLKNNSSSNRKPSYTPKTALPEPASQNSSAFALGGGGKY